jgi:curved DNA-binding protein
MLAGMEERDLYAVLGVSREASKEEIRKAYRKLARETHPDVNPGDPRAEARFKDVSFAYDVLSDPGKRKLYDEFGLRGLSEGFDPQQARAWRQWQEGARRSPSFESYTTDVDLEDLLGGLFGGRRARGPGRGFDVEGEVAVDLLDAVRGAEVRVEVAGRALSVRIPPGSDDGSRIRLRGQGEPGPGGGPAGDLYLTLRVRPHPLFRREGTDLHLEVPVSVPELVLGAEVEVPTPDGSVSMRVPPRSQSGRRMRLRGKGVPRRRGGGRGDLYVTLVAQLPAGDDPRLERLAKEMEPLYAGADLRARLKGKP